MTPELKATYAQQIKDNPIWDELYEEIKRELFEEFIANTDIETRERIALAVDMIDDLRVKLEAYIVEGIPLNVGDNNAAS